MASGYDKNDSNSDNKLDRIIIDERIIRFGERLREAMKGESNNSFAKKCGMSERVIRNYLDGTTYPSIDRLAILASAAGCSIEWLTTGYEVSDNNAESVLSAKEAKALPPSDKQQKVWSEILERMTPEERELVLDNVFRQGINVLLGKASATGSNPNDSSFDDLSADDMLIARMYASLTPEDKKSFLESFIEDGHNKANRSLSDKTKAS
ncbi:helix-turn-helix transcriptional regulator [Providencia rettgeri]|uniref:helix-turn-helix domain-containing protein n=1 Tax=Providencia rettgeri TaxID=587 RepID=UPI003018C3CF